MFQATSAAKPIDRAWIEEPRREATVELLLAACLRDPVLAEPAVLPQLERERAALARRWPIRGRELDRLLRGMKQPLFPYQREGVDRFLRVGRLLLADDMGLGKTAQAIASCHALFAAGKARRAVVVAPAALKPQWAREWRGFTDLALVTVEGHPDERARIYRRRGDGVLLVNYEQLLRDLALVRGYAPDLVVLDEAQRIKNWEFDTYVCRLTHRSDAYPTVAATATVIVVGDRAGGVWFLDLPPSYRSAEPSSRLEGTHRVPAASAAHVPTRTRPVMTKHTILFLAANPTEPMGARSTARRARSR
jgi:hypothetical protein